ncbi:family 20 glycosylhydrolase [Microbacterium sp. SLBN-146]|uniref:family 20 glycosylhydrolase n=1 Tax=Microbacterium sp. SLBN-146 TaxID=2768457 RepID=UPI001154F716|nr:family 20 glycosylhydrolase [Microbacterium sp. SLBN-146]TQJ29578.1 hexosaminidase [Microbacterium sp. SLBN-146]
MTPPAVVPAPRTLATGDGNPFVLSPSLRIAGDAEAADVLAALLAIRTRGDVAPRTTDGGSDGGPLIELRVEPGEEREGYRVTADAASVVVTGTDAAGLFYGVQTVGQLVRRNGDAWMVTAVAIEDAPRFAYRGVMLDVARHFFGPDAIRAYIDRAASLKFNALHLHLTDDQGWRLALKSRPELTEHGSGTSVGGDPGGFYTREEYRDIVAYAASRHMIVVPEVDVPGHTHAVGLAYPELAAAPVLTDDVRAAVAQFGGGLPTAGVPYDGFAVGFSSLEIQDERTYDFLADVFGELASLTPGPYLHLGGDEALGTAPDDFAEFMRRASAIVADLGKTPIAWHEAGAAPGLDDATVGQYWGFVTPTDGADEKARRFAQLILSPADAVYLDMKFAADSPLGLTWARGTTTLSRAYAWEPTDVVEGVDEDDILGVEAPLWTETIRTLGEIDGMAFPRIAAAAEIAWSPRAAASGLRTWESFRSRVGALGPLWTSLGIRYTPLPEVEWSAEE